MSSSDLKRFVCDGCKKVLDCKESDLLAPPKNDMIALRKTSTPRGWFRFDAIVIDDWEQIFTAPLSAVEGGLDGHGHVCSADCAAQLFGKFAESMKDRLANRSKTELE